ncbi:hypothetical protein SK128_006518 [Halocaridina rubra]|uniref:Ionotropic glutamate receptor L-glutamate and glycine-binding domain-containing protein n=1 Tax=Halocaridina rubra TaxID=373956 RepID=A0AAN8ZYR1_HALRR
MRLIFLILAVLNAVAEPPTAWMDRITIRNNSSVFKKLWSELLLGPLSENGLVLYIDPSLKESSLESIITGLSLHDKSQIFVDIGSDGSLWSEQQSKEILRGGHLIHILFLRSMSTSFFQSLSVKWNPKYLMFINLGPKSARNVVKREEFQGPEKQLLIESVHDEKFEENPFELYTHFPFSKESKIQRLGTWDVDAFLFLHDIFINRFPSFEGYEFWLGTWYDDYPYLYQSKEAEEGVGDGVEVNMLDAMGTVLDFTYNLTTKPPDLKWGDLVNGTWTGMLGMVYSKDKNFTVNYFSYTPERFEDFDTSVTYWSEGFGLALLTPPPLPKWRSLYYPFTKLVWVVLIATFFLTAIILHIQSSFQEEKFLEDFSQTWIYLLQSLLDFGWPRLPEAQWLRVFIGWWSISCFIVTTAYTANLIAFLTLPLFPERIQTVEKLAESDFRVSMYDYGEFVPDALLASQDPYYRMIGEKLDLYVTDDESMYPFQNGTHAYLETYSYSLIYIFDVYEVRNAYMLREQLYMSHLCWYFQKNTAWKYKFDDAIQHLVEGGFIARWLKIKTDEFLGLDYDKKLRLASEERENTALSLSHLQGIFFILVMGWLISTFTFLFEILMHKCSR